MPYRPHSLEDGGARPTVIDLPGFLGAAVCREFTDGDREACQAIAAEAASTSYGRAMPDLAATFTADAALEPADRRWVAVWSDQIVGFIDLVGNHISNVFVAPPAQGRGVGRLLIQTVEQQTIGDLTLSVFVVNPRARALYERLGFTLEASANTNFHGVPKAVWRMRKARPLSPRYRLVVFDFDGVLADSADWMLRTLPLIIREFDLNPKTACELEALRGAPTRDVVRALGAPTWKIPSIARRMRQLSEASAGEIAVFPGVAELIRQLRSAEVATAIVSSNSEATVRAVLGDELLGGVDRLDCGVALFGKAARLRKATRRLGVRSADAVYVGDETRDIEAARRSGLASVAVAWGYGSREILAAESPTGFAETMSDLRRCLGI